MGNYQTNLTLILVLGMILMSSPSSSSSSPSSSYDKSRRKAMFFGDTTTRIGSSLVFPLHGNVYPIGYYNVTLYVGQPAKPYYLDIDTGSDLTWLQCDAPCQHCTEAPHPLYRPSNRLVRCEEPICKSLQPPNHRCQDINQCDYEVEYADGGSSLGVLLQDVFLLNFTDGKRLNPLLTLGCGYDQLPGRSNHPLDGILGLGRGISSLPSQLSNQNLVSNVVGHCLSGRGGGFLFFGDDIYDSARVTWTSMSQTDKKHYTTGFAELLFDGKSTGITNLVAIFDSGSSYTYLNSQAYQSLLTMLRRELSRKPLSEALDDQTLPYCWKGKRPFKSTRDARKYFESFTLSFKSSNGRDDKIQFEFIPEAYLIISTRGNACLGILNGTEVGLRDLNVIGDVSMLDRLVVYNNQKQLIGWAPASCDRLPTSQRSVI